MDLSAGAFDVFLENICIYIRWLLSCAALFIHGTLSPSPVSLFYWPIYIPKYVVDVDLLLLLLYHWREYPLHPFSYYYNSTLYKVLVRYARLPSSSVGRFAQKV